MRNINLTAPSGGKALSGRHSRFTTGVLESLLHSVIAPMHSVRITEGERPLCPASRKSYRYLPPYALTRWTDDPRGRNQRPADCQESAPLTE